jgi:hypothetical protein
MPIPAPDYDPRLPRRELTIVEQSLADGGHGFVLWRVEEGRRTVYPVVYPTRDQAEHAKSMVERGVAFEVIAESEVSGEQDDVDG